MKPYRVPKQGIEADIKPESVDDAARSIQQDYQRMLEPSDYKLLARTSTTKSIEKLRSICNCSRTWQSWSTLERSFGTTSTR